MTSETESRVASAERVVRATPATIFELIADPAQQPPWDGNDNLASAATGQRVHAVGDTFDMTLTKNGAVRRNHIVEFEKGRLIAWLPSEIGSPPPGHLWRWELKPQADGTTLVRHTYDWTDLTHERRMNRARRTTSEALTASIERLAAIAEGASG